jgi:hypothetical protein
MDNTPLYTRLAPCIVTFPLFFPCRPDGGRPSSRKP